MAREESTDERSGEGVQISHRDAIGLLLGRSNPTFLGCVGILVLSAAVFTAAGMPNAAFALSIGVLMLYSGRIATLAGGDVRVS